MSSHLPMSRTVHQCIRQTRSISLRQFAPRQQARFLSSTNPLRSTASPIRSTLRSNRNNEERKRTIALSGAGIVSCAIAMFGVITIYFPQGLNKDGETAQENKSSGTIKLDGPTGITPAGDPTVVVDGVEQVPTGNLTIPFFPKSIHLPRSLDTPGTRPEAARTLGEEVKPGGKEEEYYLLGLGIRSVSFLGIQVYVVGLYIAASDVAALQKRLIQQGASPPTSAGAPSDSIVAATSLVPHEREALAKLLMDPEQGEDVWHQILKDCNIRTAFRIVPTRNTDFLHLRDGWVRAITARAQKANTKSKEHPEFADDSFGQAMGDFKALLGGGTRKNVPKGQTLLLLRDQVGALEILYQPGETKPMIWLGEVVDERISRLLWMQYLAGKNVASDSARKNIVEGVMGIVERPVGTVDQMLA